MAKLTKIDDLLRGDHIHLTPDDAAYFVLEYTPGAGYLHSDTNQFISNLKKENRWKQRPDVWRYKTDAIVRAGDLLQRLLTNAKIGDQDFLTTATMVPIPPSKAINDPDHDDRILQVLQQMGRGIACDIRDLIIQTESVEAHHVGGAPRDPDTIAAHYVINERETSPTPTVVALFDDVITTGGHFVAGKRILRERWPNMPILGIFLARTAR